MAAGVRDADNLCWKLAAVLKGQLPAAVLDTYETERQPHVRAVTNRAVFFGRVITERNPLIAAVRNPAFRIAMNTPALSSYLRDAKWFPDAFYPDGFHTGAGPVIGHRTPQPRVMDEKGDIALLDDVLDTAWTVLHAGGNTERLDWAAAGAKTLRLLPAGSAATANALVDVDNLLVTWLRTRKAAAVALRPDGFVYTAAASITDLDAPPAGLSATTLEQS